MKKLLTLALTLILVGASALAQTKAETKLYNNTLKKATLAAYDKFLKKYPESVYSEEISARRDTLWSISPYSAEESKEIAKGFLNSENAEFIAFPERKEGVDRIYAICVLDEGLEYGSYRIVCLEHSKKKGWQQMSSYDRSSTMEFEPGAEISLIDKSRNYNIRGVDYYQFNILLSSPLGASGILPQSYIAASYSPEKDEVVELAFVGKSVLKDTQEPYRIEGRSNEAIVSGASRPEAIALLSILRDNPLLEQIPEDVYLSDIAVEWWLEHNPQALSNASKINVNILPEEASLITLYDKSRHKVNSAKYGAAIIDVRGYTVVVVKQKDNNSHFLAWAEPECKDKYKDRLLNSISFSDANNLSMNYYHGNKTFRYRYNLSSKTLTR